MSRALLFVLLFLPSAVPAANLRSIIEAPEVARAVAAGAILWDIRRAEDYDKGHLPGAVNINHVAQALLDEKSQLFLPTPEIERRLGNAGIDPRKPIIVYGARGSSYAHFALFALEYFGAKNVRVFHGGVDGWREARRPVSTKGFARNPVKLKLAPRPQLAIDTDEVIARLDHPGSQFLDVRRTSEWKGEEFEGLHGGHLPGAIHVPYNFNYIDPDAPLRLMKKEITTTSGMALKPDAELRALYAELDPTKAIVVYCHTGIRAALTASVLSRLGFRDVRIWHASWYDYGSRTEVRVEK